MTDDNDSIDPEPHSIYDYGSADRVEDMADTRADSDRGTGQPDEERPQTFFRPSEGSDRKQEYLEWLRKINSGAYDSSQRSDLHYGGIKRDLGVIATQLEVTDYQQDRAARVLEHIDLQEELSRVDSVETIIMAILSLVVDADRSRYDPSTNAPTPKSITRTDRFDDLRRDFSIPRDGVRRVRQSVRDSDKVEIGT